MSIATATPIFTISQSMKPRPPRQPHVGSRLVMPRANRAPGTTTVAAP